MYSCSQISLIFIGHRSKICGPHCDVFWATGTPLSKRKVSEDFILQFRKYSNFFAGTSLQMQFFVVLSVFIRSFSWFLVFKRSFSCFYLSSDSVFHADMSSNAVFNAICFQIQFFFILASLFKYSSKCWYLS